MKGLRLLKNRDFYFLIVVVAFGILASRTLLFQTGYFNMHDDLQLMRQLQMEKCFADEQIPCRWVPDMGYGYGFPLFNFYPPLPYLFGQALRFIGFGFIETAKLTFASAIILSGITMYYLAKELYGRWGGLVASVFYIWAPYHAVDVYVRGAMNEAWALVWFPLILLAGYKLATEQKKFRDKWTIVLGISFALLMLSHNLMLLIFTPVLAIWTLLFILIHKSWRTIPYFIVSGVMAFGLSAFFTLPAVVENKLTHIESTLVGYYDYSAHFVSIRQLLFSRFWGYGPSTWLEEDRMSFQIGHLHWIMSILVGIVAVGLLIGYIRRPKVFGKVATLELLLATVLMVGVGWFAAFITHARSTPIWQTFEPLAYTQFPWRLLTLVILSFSFSLGFLPYILEKLSVYKSNVFKVLSYPFRVGLVALMITVVVSINWSYFLPEYGKMGPLSINEKFSGAAWDLQQTAGIYDYLPLSADTAPKAAMSKLVEAIEGEIAVISQDQGTNWARAEVDVLSEDAQIRLGIFQFPNWRTYVDGREVDNYVPDSEDWGRMHVDIPSGTHVIEAVLTDTLVRTYANYISLISWVGLGVFIIYYNRRVIISSRSGSGDSGN